MGIQEMVIVQEMTSIQEITKILEMTRVQVMFNNGSPSLHTSAFAIVWSCETFHTLTEIRISRLMVDSGHWPAKES